MLVDRLSLVVVVRTELSIRPGDRLRGFVSLEPSIQRLVLRRRFGLTQAPITEHQVVMCLQILRIDSQHELERIGRRGELALQEEHASQLVQDDAVTRIFRVRLPEMSYSVIVAPKTLEDR